MIIKPTPGRVLHFHLCNPNVAPIQGWGYAPDNTYAAHVAYVHSPFLVNLMVIDANGVSRPQTNIPLMQEGHERPLGNWCEWPPRLQDAAQNSGSPPPYKLRDPAQPAGSPNRVDGDLAEVRRMASAGEPLIDITKSPEQRANDTSANRAELIAAASEPSAGTHPAIAATQQLDNDGQPLPVIPQD